MFEYHDKVTAPAQSVPVLEATEAAFGFLPNLHRIMSESPTLIEAYSRLYGLATEQTNLSPLEVQIVFMTANYYNSCHYCVAGHSMVMTMMKAPQEIITAMRENSPLEDVKLEALRSFAHKLLENRGHVGDAALMTFLDAGYSKSQALDVLVCLSTKLLSNFTNALAHTELDEPMKAMEWTPPEA